MYRLLILTRDDEIKKRFAEMTGWDRIGFKQPHIRENEADACEFMQKHPIDAIAFDDSPDYDSFRMKVLTQYPGLPVFPIDESVSEQVRTMNELSTLLDRISADDYNGNRDTASMLQQQQARLMRRTMMGMEADPQLLRRKMLMYRCAEDPDAPCAVAVFTIPDDDEFVSERWHYGRDRLEMALHNFFGDTHAGMRMRVAVISPLEVRVLFSPVRGSASLSEERVSDYTNETAAQIQNYLGLRMALSEVRSLPSVLSLIRGA